MKIVVDESVSFGVATYLRRQRHDVIAIAEATTSGLEDTDVFEIVKQENAVLITRDHHFTNSLRFPSEETTCIIFIRKGNLTSQEEIDLIKWFFESYEISNFKGRLITISKNQVRVR
jgi:predicted nuclease of predicted toxin-antitoxin system